MTDGPETDRIVLMKHDPYAALRLPGFRWVFACHMLTIFAMQIQSTVFGWLIYDKTSSAVTLGLSGLCLFLPVLLLALPAGHLVDSRSRTSVLMAGLAVMIAGSVMLAFRSTDVVGIPFLFGSFAIVGIGSAFVSVARPVIMRDVVTPHAAENASNWSSLGRRISSVAGPVTAGLLITAFGAQSALALAAGVFVLSLASATHIRLPPSKRKTAGGEISFLEGIRFLRKTPLVLSVTLLDMFAVLFGGATGLLPIFASDILQVGATGLGVLRAAPSLGSGAMSFALAHLPPMKRAGWSLLLSVVAYGVMTMIFGLSQSFTLSLAALLLVGAFDAVSVTIRSTILQIFVPPHLRGRVYGVNMIFVYSSNELGDFESGMVAALAGAPASVILGGIGAIVTAFCFGWQWPQLRSLKKLATPTASALAYSP